MENGQRFVLVDEQVLPTIFQKVLAAKQYLLKDEAHNLTEACRMADVSRSAFYKYKDCIAYYESEHANKDVTIYLKLSDEPGILSAVLHEIYAFQANIITLNQNVPSDTVAGVTITIRLDNAQAGVEMIMERLRQLRGVLSVRKL
jgi:chorismate mutase